VVDFIIRYFQSKTEGSEIRLVDLMVNVYYCAGVPKFLVYFSAVSYS
jgi:hypothetical protein